MKVQTRTKGEKKEIKSIPARYSSQGLKIETENRETRQLEELKSPEG